MPETNSEKMTIAERLAQRLKTSTMGELMNEDDLRVLCEQAIKEAFFKPQRHDYQEREPWVVQNARQLFHEEMKASLKKVVEELAKTEEFAKALMIAAVAALPEVLMAGGRQLAFETAFQQAQGATQNLADLIQRGVIRGPTV